MSESPAPARGDELITRPNGKVCRPRKIIAYAVESRDEETLIVVLGTHDVERAKPLADRAYAFWGDNYYEVADPRLVWWRDGMECGQRRWIDDEVHGRPGVFFAGIKVRDE